MHSGISITALRREERARVSWIFRPKADSRTMPLAVEKRETHPRNGSNLQANIRCIKSSAEGSFRSHALLCNDPLTRRDKNVLCTRLCTRGTSRALADSTRALSFFAALSLSRAVSRGHLALLLQKFCFVAQNIIVSILDEIVQVS